MPEARQHDKSLQFYAVAEPLFERYGFRKTTVEEICRAAGVSKRTYYELFRDKADLLTRMLVHLASEAALGWRDALDPDQPTVEKVLSYLDGYEAFGRQHPAFAKCMHEIDNDVCSREFENHPSVQAMRDALAGVLAEGVARGELRPLDPPTLVWIIDSLLDTMYYMFPQMTGRVSALEDPLLASELRAFIINGIRNPDHDPVRRTR
ncbi:MAG: TetR/AcrR family transcriptional regulator [bacterium]|jgi:AcrR family transcriptional regulator|nr:TetR/AcrR family transcriptional regulator [bacterium]